MYESYEGQLRPLCDLFYEGVSTPLLFPAFYIPILMVYFVGFFVVFEFSCNLYADLSGFADRQFYLDYWNSMNFDEYARKWNRLVHEFLYRHFYLEALVRFGWTSFQSNVYTFVFSVVFHEIYLTLFFKSMSFYLTSLQINQLIAVFFFSMFKKYFPLFSNMIFWGS